MQNIRHLHSDAIVVVHAAKHLTKIVRVDLIWDPSEVLDTVSGSPEMLLKQYHSEIWSHGGQITKSVLTENAKRFGLETPKRSPDHLLTCSWHHMGSAWWGCCWFWQMWSNHRWMSSLSCQSRCSQTRHTLGKRLIRTFEIYRKVWCKHAYSWKELSISCQDQQHLIYLYFRTIMVSCQGSSFLSQS